MTDKNGIELNVGDYVKVYPIARNNIKKYYGSVGKIISLKTEWLI